MVFGRSLTFIILSLCAASLQAQAIPRQIEPSAAAQIQHGVQCLQVGRFSEACGAADLVMLSNTVKISIEDSPSDAVEQAIACWQNKLGGAIQFEKVTESPDVTVQFVTKIAQGNRNSIGYSHWQRILHPNGTFKLRAEITIATQYPNGRPVTLDSQRHAAMHEIGHLLGLEDSKKVGDVMGPNDPKSPALAPTNTEVEAIQTLRQIARNLHEEAANLSEMNLGGYNFDREIG